ncbi:hypothetical protein RU86_GL000862 [Lactococcus piscium]|uniref:Uncharacterized protein n=1 Tax=Pseudolactococcus piscium TaxID=1364 RepID=A0A2A5RVR8_9LACT|nr:hypothetical protein RU86_GL000862 [Lactococcus piscium]
MEHLQLHRFQSRNQSPYFILFFYYTKKSAKKVNIRFFVIFTQLNKKKLQNI